MIALITYLTTLNDTDKQVIVLADETNLFKSDFQDTETTKYLVLPNQPVDVLKSIVKEGTYSGLLHIDNNVFKSGVFSFFGQEPPSLNFVDEIESKISTRLTNKNLLDKGVKIETVNAATVRASLSIENFAGELTNKRNNYIKAAFGGAAGYLLMMFIIIYGNMVMRSVIEEKTNRIIEVIISSVKPFELMMGKILGTTLAGITQFVVWILLGGVAMLVLTTFFGLNAMDSPLPQAQAVNEIAENQEMVTTILTEVIKLPWLQLLGSFLIYFIGGYFLYSSIYASIGAAVDGETDTQQFMFPIIMPLMLGIYVGFFSVINNPHGVVATVFSIVPLTSPIVMLMRIPFGVPLWQLVLSICVLIASFGGTVFMASKIYRVGILMYGKKASYKEIYKWIKYKS